MEIQNIDARMLSIIILGSGGAFLLSASVIFFFIRYQRKTQLQKETLLKAELAFKQELLYANIRSQEEERVRISKELHDHVGGTLSVLRFLVDQLDPVTPGVPPDEKLIVTYKEMIDGVINDVRHISHTMAPPGLALWGLQEALTALCEKISMSSGININVSGGNAESLKRLPFDQSLSLYRVVQELLTNTLKHASAQTISVAINETENQLLVVYSDDGIGTDTDLQTTKGMGMQNIENRLMMIGATYAIKTAAGQGFTFSMQVPQQQTIDPN